MRKKVSGDVDVVAVSGTHVVFLGFDMPKAAAKRLMGFAIHRKDKTELEGYWLRSIKTNDPHENNALIQFQRTIWCELICECWIASAHFLSNLGLTDFERAQLIVEAGRMNQKLKNLPLESEVFP